MIKKEVRNQHHILMVYTPVTPNAMWSIFSPTSFANAVEVVVVVSMNDSIKPVGLVLDATLKEHAHL